ncbi:ribosome bioproteinsis protein ytm1 [Sporothrix epigloea]|uniref:Ribosome bioproteinsis protein ytm1 n=1 Tax=Sporothrix epigloea TaxID=1892477 RepID=A0ABP0DIQ8_9PEZI
MSAVSPPSVIGQALVDFSLRGDFPADNDVATAALHSEALPDAIRMLAHAKATLEAEIQQIISDTAGDVQAWIDNAKALQVALARRKTLAGDILARANDNYTEAEKNGEQQRQQTAAEAEAEVHARFLTSELNYNLQVRYLLEAIRSVSGLLDKVEQASSERRILDALRLLERTWATLDAMPVSKSCRAMQLLNARAFDLKANVHDVFDHVWSALVHVQVDTPSEGAGASGKRLASLTINETRPDEPMSLSDAVIGLKAYKEVDHRMTDLWHALDHAIVAPRMDLAQPMRRRIYVEGQELGLAVGSGLEETDTDAGLLFEDLERLLSFLAQRLPADLVQSMSSAMMPELVARIINVWMVSAIPLSLDQMATFERTLEAAQAFCARLAALHYVGFGLLTEWIESAPRAWLSTRREATLDAVRKIVANGVGTPREVEKIEKQMVSRTEGKELATATEQASDWNMAWTDEEDEDEEESQAASRARGQAKPSKPVTTENDEDGADEWGAWDDDGDGANEPAGNEPDSEAVMDTDTPADRGNDDDDDTAADAWGWGDENTSDADEQPSQQPISASPKKAKKQASFASAQQPKEEQATRQMVMKEKYHLSAMPGPMLDLISSILEDGAALISTDHESSPVAAAAAGLFGLPALALAMFRAVSPHYYALDVGGSMYLYNDATYLAERLIELVATWRQRLPSSSSMLRLDGEIAKLQAFASRAYGREMAVQKTVLRDLLGGDQNVLQGCGSGGNYNTANGTDEDAEDYVDAAVTRVRSMAAAWQDVLAPSAWSQAVGALADAVAQKLISDVLDMPSISQDEAFGLANLISKVTELDDLFPAPADDGDVNKDRVPMTSQYAPNWLRLQYLSEVLQSNLREVRYLWMESELSLYFTADEVVDLLRLSFEDNARSREVAREIAARPHPVES